MDHWTSQERMRDWAATASHRELLAARSQAQREGDETFVEIINEELSTRE
jgi:hypothetical protein